MTLTAEPDRIDLDHATGACIVRLREERDAAVAALRDRDATIARLTAAVREYLAADEYAAEHDVDDADSGHCTFAEFSGGVDRLKAARSALDALTREP